MVGGDVLFGLGLTLLAWAGLVVTVLRGRATIERLARRARGGVEDTTRER